MTSQKEFMLGCLIGGVLGASAAVLVSSSLLNGVKRLQPNKGKKHAVVKKAKSELPSKRAKIRKSKDTMPA